MIVPGVADAFRADDLARLGALMDRSQALAEHALENHVPQTITPARLARAYLDSPLRLLSDLGMGLRRRSQCEQG